MPTVNVLSGTLRIGGVSIPAPGAEERFKITFPPEPEPYEAKSPVRVGEAWDIWTDTPEHGPVWLRFTFAPGHEPELSEGVPVDVRVVPVEPEASPATA